MAVVLVDTNILLYAHDRGERTKQIRAIQVLRQLHLAGNGRLSVQSLGEFFRAITRGPAPRLTEEQATKQVERLARAWSILDLTPAIVLEALRGVRERDLAYWDAQLWATARLNQVPVIFSENFNPGSILDGVRFVNPFAPDFSVQTWR